MNGTQGTASVLHAILKPSPCLHAPMARRSTSERCASALFLHPEDTRVAAGNTMRQKRKDCEAECHGHANPNFWAGNVCHGKALRMTQIASPPPSGATEQQPSLARGAGPHGGMTQSSGIGEKPTEQSRQHPIPLPPKHTQPHVILIKRTTTVLR